MPRLARSLDRLRTQLNNAAPRRSKASDGWIGDAAHATRASDHNPWIKVGHVGVVTALDITHDPAGGMDCHKLADALVRSRDVRIKYLIWNRRIWNPLISLDWRSYGGSNPHTKHLHISVQSAQSLFDDDRPWSISGFTSTAAPTSHNPGGDEMTSAEHDSLKRWVIAHTKAMADEYRKGDKNVLAAIEDLKRWVIAHTKAMADEYRKGDKNVLAAIESLREYVDAKNARQDQRLLAERARIDEIIKGEAG